MLKNKLRGFEVVSSYKASNIQLPRRQTKYSAGYDIEAAERVVLPSYWQQSVAYVLKQWQQRLFTSASEEVLEDQQTSEIWRASLVPTGLKAYMQSTEYLKIVNRSSGSYKHFTSLPNGIGIIDADYYNNEKNEGHIYVQLVNFGLRDRVIEKGERIAQGIFMPYLLIDEDEGGLGIRQGGFGSSDQFNDSEHKKR